jgi:hypothetical protein
MSTDTGNSSRLIADLTADNLTQHVIRSCIAQAPDERTKELISGLIQHVHDYVREVQMKPGEWEAGWKFLTEVSEPTLFHAMVFRKSARSHNSDNLGRTALYC